LTGESIKLPFVFEAVREIYRSIFGVATFEKVDRFRSEIQLAGHPVRGLIRPVQRVFPLEVSGNDATSLPLQKVQHTDSSVNCPNLDTLNLDTTEKIRCGRPGKKPVKLNLLTLADVFD
ncbi:hypothetical protein TNCV_3216491, partial [Trichonephila clavipes]